MRRLNFRFRILALLLASGGMISPEAARSGERWEDFAQLVGARVGEERSVRGQDPSWLFLRSELRHVAAGEFWERPWEEVAANKGDAAAYVVEFAQALAAREVRLVLVPVPAKAVIYPDKVASDFSPGDALGTAAFYDQLRSRGVEVIDIEGELLAMRKSQPTEKLYCEQDAHFSPYTAAWLGETLAQRAEAERGVKQSRDGWALSEPESIVIAGDQVVGSDWEGKIPPETLSLTKVIDRRQGEGPPRHESPVLVLGDSHTLVFHEGASSGMHASGAGVVDHLSYHLGGSVDAVGVRGSGLVQARKQLYYHATRHPDYWGTKRIVFWIFSVREFTQSTDKLVPIPLDK